MRIPARNFSVLSFSHKAEHSSTIAKLAYFYLKMMSAVNCEESVGSWKSVN